MPLARPILQKGDNFRVPERKEHLRYASDYHHRRPHARRRQAEGEVHPRNRADERGPIGRRLFDATNLLAELLFRFGGPGT